MYWVTRKMTGKIVGRNVPQEALEAYLSTLPSGVYGVEDSQGKETEVTVKSGRIRELAP